MKLNEIGQDLKKIVKDTYNVYKNINKTKNELKKMYDLNISNYNIRYILQEDIVRERKKINNYKNELKNINKNIKEKKNYEITDDYYIFYVYNIENWVKTLKSYPIPISVVDNIFKDYSKHWNNLTTEKILQKYSLKPEFFYMLKNRLRIYKDSNILSPVSLQRLEPSKVNEKITNVIDETIQDKYKKSFVDIYEQRKNKKYKQMSRILSWRENFLEWMEKYLKNYKPIKLDFELKKIENNDEIIVLFSDLHIWKMETHKVLKRIELMGKDLIKREEKKINLICLGDLVENITTSEMHIWQRKSQDIQDPYETIMITIKTLEQLLMSLLSQWKEITFTWLSWNHTRLAIQSFEDKDRIVWLLIYEILKRTLKDFEIKFNILREWWNKLNIMGYNVILHHWDGTVKKNVTQILWELWDQNTHNLIVFWHIHKFDGEDISNNATKIIVPWLAWKNVYDNNLLLSSYTWYVIVEKEEDGTPKQIVRRFNL